MLIRVPYNRAAAVAYAEKWAFSRNPEYYDFHGIGGDCTNFVSQCIYAGCGVMNYTPEYGWYYIDLENRSPSWSGVEFFYDFFSENQSVGPHSMRAPLSRLLPGDVVQLGREDGSFYHTLLVLSNDSEILVAAHTNDALYRPLSSYQFDQIRALHITDAFRWD